MGVCVAVGVGIGVSVGIGVGVSDGTGVSVAVGSGDGVAVGSSVFVGTGVGVSDGTGVGVTVGSGGGVAVGSSVFMGTGVDVSDGTGVGILVGTEVGVLVGASPTSTCSRGAAVKLGSASSSQAAMNTRTATEARTIADETLSNLKSILLSLQRPHDRLAGQFVDDGVYVDGDVLDAEIDEPLAHFDVLGV